jgi:regulator of cell morphogenesis and NO signaling
MENIKQLTLGQIVTLDYKASLVFQKYGIDFCCMGGRNLVDS